MEAGTCKLLYMFICWSSSLTASLFSHYMFGSWLALLIMRFCRCSLVSGTEWVSDSCSVFPTLCGPTDFSLPEAPLSMEFSRQEYWSGFVKALTMGRCWRAATAALLDLDLTYEWCSVITGSTFRLLLTVLNRLLRAFDLIRVCLSCEFFKVHFLFTYMDTFLTAIKKVINIS